MNTNKKNSLPVDAVIMAGGKGVRLRPLTYKAPKPMLEIVDKPMIAHNIEKLIAYGVKNIYISVFYLKEQIIDYVNQHYGDYQIKFIEEDKPLGTIGALSLVNHWDHNDILLLNADIMCGINYTDFYQSHKKSKADMSLAASDLKLQIPYGVLREISKNQFIFEEKPTIEYCATAGIYMFDKKLISRIPLNTKYDATDLIISLINDKVKLNKFLVKDYWLDVGSKQTYEQAQKLLRNQNK